MSIREQLLVGSKVIVKSTTGGSGLYEGFITEILETSQSCMVYFEGSNRLFETSWSNIKSVENVVDVIE